MLGRVSTRHLILKWIGSQSNHKQNFSEIKRSFPEIRGFKKNMVEFKLFMNRHPKLTIRDKGFIYVRVSSWTCYVTRWAVGNLSAPQGIVWNLK